MNKTLSKRVWTSLAALIVTAGAVASFATFSKTASQEQVEAGSEIGTVIQIFDGATFRVEVGERELNVRLFQIAAPAKNSPHAGQSLQALHDLTIARVVALTFRGQDSEGTWLADVELDGKDVAAEQLSRGLASIQKSGQPVPPHLAQQEAAARVGGKGIWGRS